MQIACMSSLRLSVRQLVRSINSRTAVSFHLRIAHCVYKYALKEYAARIGALFMRNIPFLSYFSGTVAFASNVNSEGATPSFIIKHASAPIIAALSVQYLSLG